MALAILGPAAFHLMTGPETLIPATSTLVCSIYTMWVQLQYFTTASLRDSAVYSRRETKR